jgi:CubicO group peptidase (beta-lactamase class C family)
MKSPGNGLAMGRLARAVLPAVLVFGAAACGGTDPADPGATVSSTEPAAATTAAPTATSIVDGFTVSAELDAEMAAIIDEHDIPSVGVAIVVGDQVVWSAGYGDQAAPDTTYQIGSIEKVFMVTAIYQLVEEGSIDPTADVSDYLPFEVRHPDYPDVPITVSMLLTHTSGLSHDLPDSMWFDNDDAFLAFGAEYDFWDLDDSPFLDGRPSLGEYLQSWLASDGAHAGEPGAWSGPPGRWSYSNIALAHLSAYLVERLTGLPFYDYVEEHIFEPLAMKDSFTDATDLSESRIAVPHTRYEGTNRALLRTGMRSSDRIRMTAADLAVFLALHMNDGRFGDVELLSSESASAIREPQITLGGTDFPGLGLRGQGMAWTTWDEGRSGHSGATPGHYGVMMMQETDHGRIGVVILQNVGCSLFCDQGWFTAGHVAMRNLLLDEARRLAAGRT